MDYGIPYEEAVAQFLGDHPEFYPSDLEYCPDVFREMCEETGYTGNYYSL